MSPISNEPTESDGYQNFIEQCDKILTIDKRDGKLLNINEVTADQISKTVVGIGEGVAKKIEKFIVERKGISNMDDLLSIKGFGPEKLELLKKHFQAYETKEELSKLKRIEERLVNALPHLFKKSAKDCKVIENDNYDISRSYKSKKFFCLHLNAVSSNAETFIDKLKNNSILRAKIICFSSTWNADRHNMVLENYKYLQCQPPQSSRPTNIFDQNAPSESGGVGMFIHEDIEYEDLKIDDDYEQKKNLKVKDLPLADSEHLWVKITESKVVVGVVYRLPRDKNEQLKNFAFDFLRIIHKLINSGLVFYIFGDFNIDLLENTDFHKCFYYSICALGCKQLISKPTRYTASSGALTLLDHIYTNASTENLEAGIIQSDISDHYPTFCSTDSHQQVELTSIPRLEDIFKGLAVIDQIE